VAAIVARHPRTKDRFDEVMAEGSGNVTSRPGVAGDPL
jgi:hypothetical protein